MKSLQNPYPGATFQDGIGGRHSWIGHSPSDPDEQMRYAEFIGVVARFIDDRAPDGVETDSWKY